MNITENKKNVDSPKSISQVPQEDHITDVLVIGGGMAGVFAGIKAKEEELDVIMAVKGAAGSSGMTPFANTFMVFDESRGHREQAWIEKFQKSSEYMLNMDYMDMFLKDSLARWNDLESWGAIGVKNFGPMLRKAVKKSGVKLLERVMITDLLKNDGRIVGAMGFPFEEDRVIVIKARAVIMCAGPGGFKPNGYPISSVTHDGDAMALRAGAAIGGKEFIDFHVTGNENPADAWFVWKDMYNGINRTEQPAGRAMEIIQLPRATRSGHLPTLGYTPPPNVPPPPGGWPNLSLAGKEIVGNAGAGLGIHKSEGIWPADGNCGTELPGLFAAGDALCSMLCGAAYTGLGSSLSGSAVQGARAGLAAAAYAVRTKKTTVKAAEIKRTKHRIFGPRLRDKGFTPAWVTQQLQNTMIPYYVLQIKEKGRMEAALKIIAFLREQPAVQLRACSPHELRLGHETQNMLLNAEMKLRAGLYRKETRGSHIREDYPTRRDPEWLAWVLCRLENGKIKCSKKPVPKKWRPDPKLKMSQKYWYTLPGEK